MKDVEKVCRLTIDAILTKTFPPYFRRANRVMKNINLIMQKHSLKQTVKLFHARRRKIKTLIESTLTIDIHSYLDLIKKKNPGRTQPDSKVCEVSFYGVVYVDLGSSF